MRQQKIGFIGAGNMASSLIKGLVEAGYPTNHLFVSDPDKSKIDLLSAQQGIKACHSNSELVAQSDVVVLAVKPQFIKDVCCEVSALLLQHNNLIISIAAGISTDSILRWVNPLSNQALPIVRCMPNTPALLKLGASGLFATQCVSVQQKTIAKQLFDAIGITCWLDNESQIDSITALSGSGPAYYFLFIEAMIEAAQQMGLERSIASQFAIQTALGAATMASQCDDVVTLRQQVTSPGGTTEQAIASFEQAEIRGIIHQAMQSAANRALELSAQLAD